MQVRNTYLWERHVTLKAFWRLLLQGRGPGDVTVPVHVLTAVTALPLAVALIAGAWRARRAQETTDAVIAAPVATAPLLMPFYFDYDLLLLAVPAVLAALHHRPSRLAPRLIVTWVALYVWLYVNPYFGAFVRVNVAVPLLAGLSALLIASLREQSRLAEQIAVEDSPANRPLREAA